MAVAAGFFRLVVFVHEVVCFLFEGDGEVGFIGVAEADEVNRILCKVEDVVEYEGDEPKPRALGEEDKAEGGQAKSGGERFGVLLLVYALMCDDGIAQGAFLGKDKPEEHDGFETAKRGEEFSDFAVVEDCFHNCFLFEC
ncbi:MAG: hypothetical protein LBL33_02940 [Tannerella sp.]|jgi:hypothetical protein|nr:hypothetical protein [Tannerella sp.]